MKCFTSIWEILTGQSKDSLTALNIAQADWDRTVGDADVMPAEHFKDCLFNLTVSVHGNTSSCCQQFASRERGCMCQASWTEDTKPIVYVGPPTVELYSHAFDTRLMFFHTQQVP